MLKHIRTDKKIIIGLSLSLLVVSLTQPAFFTANDNSDSLNLHSEALFFFGWMGFLGGAFESFFWFANPLYVLAIILFVNDNRKAVFISLAANIIAISFAFLSTVIANEGGGRTAITGLGAGYILWLSAISVLTTGILLSNVLRLKKSTQTDTAN